MANQQPLIKPQKLSEQILAVLEERIVSGEYPVGSKLPPERKLAEAFGVSRPSVRSALKMLVARDMLEARQGDGYYVSAKPQQDFLLGWQSLLGNHPAWETDVFDFSRSMEGCMAALAAERRTDADLKRIGFWLQKFEQAYQSGSREQQAEADVSFHQAIAEAAHNILFAQLSGGLLNLLYRQTRSYIMHTEQIEDPRPTLIKHHRALFEAIERKQPREAAQIAEGHLSYVAESLRQDREYQSRSEHADTLAQHDLQRTGDW
ncbi:FadR family transcriptional regulator [Uruburuella testudinis]|uniref:Pyruvate dehydrogenase complex repressor n=1 Tax=Uruburuella testudinis TaxID=1282863 RepID=A0ABY4DRH3_9NEIS|nr:FadR/GntR family transcriptional regulator [Uruburuella testudinis]UOO81533.1 FadR family transcriptional regulator [Uruburuella testudinis]